MIGKKKRVLDEICISLCVRKHGSLPLDGIHFPILEDSVGAGLTKSFEAALKDTCREETHVSSPDKEQTEKSPGHVV